MIKIEFYPTIGIIPVIAWNIGNGKEIGSAFPIIRVTIICAPSSLLARIHINPSFSTKIPIVSDTIFWSKFSWIIFSPFVRLLIQI
jgi:hypothetical protein